MWAVKVADGSAILDADAIPFVELDDRRLLTTARVEKEITCGMRKKYRELRLLQFGAAYLPSGDREASAVGRDRAEFHVGADLEVHAAKRAAGGVVVALRVNDIHHHRKEIASGEDGALAGWLVNGLELLVRHFQRDLFIAQGDDCHGRRR